MLLREIAHSRTGDKGNLVMISLIAYRAEDYNRLVETATVERVSKLFGSLIVEPVTRYEIPNLQALNFVLKRSLQESVTRSLAIDAHGKSLGSLLLGMEL
jgi:hypothetical protein